MAIVRKLAALVLALALMAGGAPVAMAATGMDDCGMAMGSADMQASMFQDQQGMIMTAPMPKQEMPCKDMGGLCVAACAGAMNLPHMEYSPMLGSKSAVPGWSVQTELAGIRSRPDLPPPIAIL